MIYQIKSYFQFLLKSSNQHGIHSPFVYNLITKCFYKKTKFPEYSTLKSLRKNLLKDNSTIDITDFGQGSRVFKTNTRKVSAIAKNAGITPKRQRLLFRLTNYLESETILELGTSLGMATAAMALGNKDSEIITIEGCPNIALKATQVFNDFKLQNIELLNQTFEDFFSETKMEAFDLVFIDGNHNKKKTLEYFNILLDYAHNDSVFIFDDIYWSPEMTKAWHEIIQHSKITVSIDTFYWGLVFFRKEQPKQHFHIRL